MPEDKNKREEFDGIKAAKGPFGWTKAKHWGVEDEDSLVKDPGESYGDFDDKYGLPKTPEEKAEIERELQENIDDLNNSKKERRS